MKLKTWREILEIIQMKEGDDIATLLEVRPIRTVKIADLSLEMASRSPCVFGPFAGPGVVCVGYPEGAPSQATNARKAAYLWEVAPSTRVINYTTEGSSFTFHIKLPYQYAAVLLVNNSPVKMHVYTRNEPISSVSYDLFPMPLTNCFSSGKVCTGNVLMSSAGIIEEKLDFALNAFFGSEFNSDLDDVLKRHLPDSIINGSDDPLDWFEQLSLRDHHELEGMSSLGTARSIISEMRSGHD